MGKVTFRVTNSIRGACRLLCRIAFRWQRKLLDLFARLILKQINGSVFDLLENSAHIFAKDAQADQDRASQKMGGDHQITPRQRRRVRSQNKLEYEPDGMPQADQHREQAEVGGQAQGALEKENRPSQASASSRSKLYLVWPAGRGLGRKTTVVLG